MRMRKLIILLSLVLSISLVSPVANAAGVKAGDKCKKVNQTVSAGGQNLVCKKQGKKRVWVVAKKQPAVTASPSTSASEEMSAKGYTKADVASRNTTSNCWTIIGNKVYDLTQWVSRHPGGSSAIASLCGIDGTSRFRNQHGSSGRPSSELDRYYIGDLKS
jgi:cytochrome b involved in lipid metabolism